MSESKKNKIMSYISNTQGLVQLVITLASVVIILVGLWLTTRLAPLREDISLLQERVNASNQKDAELGVTLLKVQEDTTQIKSDVSEIKGFLRGSKP